MKVVVLDGLFDETYSSIADQLITPIRAHNNDVTHLKLREMNIAYCTGCWDCWVKTPGLCRHKDNTPLLLKTIISSDIVIHLTQNSLGCVTSLSKKSMDKIIPLVHPYIELQNGECHHVERYPKQPLHGLIVIDPDTNEQDFELIKEHVSHALVNLKTEWAFNELIDPKGGNMYELDCTQWFA